MVNYNKKRGSSLHSIEKRAKKFDINGVSVDQLVALSANIGKAINAILMKAKKEAQDILDVYGMQLKIQYSLEQKELEKKPETDEKPANTEEH